MGSNTELKYVISLKDLFSKGILGSIKQVEKLDDKMSKVGSNIGSTLAGIGATIGIGALGKEILDTGVQFDSYKVRLETLLGSQQKASKAFEQIKLDAMSTPFDVGSLTQANTMLIGAGASADDARHTIMGLGNAIAATGGGSDELSRMAVNLQQIKTLGKASSMDVKQFAFAGIPIYRMLQQSTGKSVEQLKEMDITYEQLQASFDKAAAKGGMFYNGLAKQSATVGGQISNLKDQFTNAMVDIYDKMKPMISSIIKMLSNLISWVMRNQETIVFFGKVVALIGAVVLAYKAWIAATVALEAVNAALNATLKLNPWGLLMAGIAALALVFYELYKNMKSVEELHNSMAKKNVDKAIKDETNQIDFLAKKYEKLGQSKEMAQKSALRVSKKMLAADYADLKNKLANAKTPEEKRVAQLALSTIGGRNQAIADYAGGGASGIDALNASGGLAGTGKSSKTLGTGTEVTGARPQSLTINITKLIEEFNISTSNMQESAMKIKEMVAKALLEAVNDVNQMNMA